MATHSNIVWKIPWTDKPGRLQSMGLQSDGAHTRTHTHRGIMAGRMIGNKEGSMLIRMQAIPNGILRIRIILNICSPVPNFPGVLPYLESCFCLLALADTILYYP